MEEKFLYTGGEKNRIYTSSDTTETKRTKMAELHYLENYGTLEFTNLPSISPQSDFPSLRILGLACEHAKFRDFFGFVSPLFGETFLEENSPAQAGQVMAYS